MNDTDITHFEDTYKTYQKRYHELVQIPKRERTSKQLKAMQRIKKRSTELRQQIREAKKK